jgi:transglutaminase-like putative cysteine protease
VRWNLGIVVLTLAFGACDLPTGGNKDKVGNAPVVELDRMSSALATGRAVAKSRTFDFTYEVTVTKLEKGKHAKLWVPVAQTNDDQQAKLVGQAVKSGAEGAEGKFTTEKEYGNALFYVETDADEDGEVNVKLSYRVTRYEVKGETGRTRKDDADTIRRFMQPDQLVPIDGKPLELLKGKELPDDSMKKARVLYDLVNNHMKYDKKGKEWGRGDSVWACDSKYGNCTDFHSLFISLARSQKIPAKFEMGFAIPTKRGEGNVAGYHCWAFFRPEGKAWVPVDISEANQDPNRKDYYFGNLTEDRVTFTTGRDLTLEPKQRGSTVNFLIYPYVEVDGEEYDAAKIVRKFTYKDVAR